MNSQRVTRLFSICAVFGLSLGVLIACATAAAGDPPAHIDKPNAQSRLALQNAISKILGVSYVVLADDALTRESTLTIEPARVRDFAGQRIQGREIRMPEQFRLVKTGRACVLIHVGSGKRLPLEHTLCKEV